MPDFTNDFTNDVTKAAKDLANVARDATYVAIGAGVLGYQQAQVQRQELRKRLSNPTAGFACGLQGVRSELTGVIQTVDAKVEDIVERVESAFVPFEDRLPGQARDLSKQVRVQVKETRAQIRNLILTAAA